MNKPKVLIADEEPMLCEAIAYILNGAGFDAFKVSDAEQLITVARETSPELVLLSENLPCCPDPEAATPGECQSHSRPCCELREDEGGALHSPILMWGTDSRATFRVSALSCGVDDYLVKPFGMRELVARAQRLVRRPGAAPLLAETERLQAGALHLSAGTRQVWIDDEDGKREIALSPTQFDLLHFLMAYQGQIVSRETLLERLWNRIPPYSRSDGHLVDVYIGQIRRRLGDDPKSPRFVFSHVGKGFTVREGLPD